MNARLSYAQASPTALHAMMGLEKQISKGAVEAPLAHLVKLRVSQMNGCAFCIDMHWKDLRALGEPEQRLYGLDVWEESPYYTDRERAALYWAESLTNVQNGHVPDGVYEVVRPHFTDAELTDLTLVVAAINAWNRFAIAFRATPGTYVTHLQPA